VNPANVMIAAARWLRLIAIAIMTTTEVSAVISNGKEAVRTGLDMIYFLGSIFRIFISPPAALTPQSARSFLKSAERGG